MTTVVSIDDYCKNPENWKSKLSNNVINYYDSICEARQDLNNQKSDLGQIGLAVPEGLFHMLEGIITPQGLSMLGAIMGVTIGVKAAYAAMVKSLVSGVSATVKTAMSEMVVAEGASPAAVNATMLLDNFMTTMTLETFGENAGRYALGALLKGAELLGDLISAIGIPLMLVQLIGMIFDAWDPCHLNDQLDANSIQAFNQQFDNVFRTNVLPMVDSVVDSYGQTYQIYVWPVEYFADRGFLLQAKEDYYGPIRTKLMVRYLNSLDFNSDGQPIRWPKGGTLLDNEQLKGLSKTVALVAADENTVVANWLAKWWPIILVVLIILIIIIVFKIK